MTSLTIRDTLPGPRRARAAAPRSEQRRPPLPLPAGAIPADPASNLVGGWRRGRRDVRWAAGTRRDARGRETAAAVHRALRSLEGLTYTVVIHPVATPSPIGQQSNG